MKVKSNFTKRSLEALAAPAEGRALYWDSEVRGLGFKIQPSGHRCFFWSRKANGKLEWKTLGEFADIGVEEARARATKMNRARDKWKEDHYAGESPFAKPVSPTLGEIVAAYAERHIRARTTQKDPARAARHVLYMLDRYAGKWKDRQAREIRRADLVALHEETRAKFGVYPANRTIQLIRAALNFAKGAGLWEGANPTEGMRMFKEVQRERFLNAEEMAALVSALDAKSTDRDFADFVRLALMTAARKSDVLGMAWRDVDFQRMVWTVPTPKGARPYLVTLDAPASDILAARKNASEWVFPSKVGEGHAVNFWKPWKKLLADTGITDLRIHDLRRTKASWAAAGGASLLIIAKMLGHRSLASAGVYARLQLDAIRPAAEAANAAMFAAAGQQKLLTVAPKPLRAVPKQLPAAPRRKAARRG